MKKITDFNLEDKKVLIRCDFNVPIKDGVIIDDTRIKASLETINYALEKKAKVILFSHLGRVKEEIDLIKNDLQPVALHLQKLLNRKVIFINKTRGEELEQAINNMQSQDVLLVQNTRYEDLVGKKESSNDKELGEYWASLGDIFINDAFGTLHRAHASNAGIASHVPCGIGFLIEKELVNLELVKKPEKPFVVILGGAKVKDKVGVISSLINQADYILIGGGMAYTFLKNQGYEIGTSLLDSDNLSFCHEILTKYPDKIVLPVDTWVSLSYSDEENKKLVATSEIPKEYMGLDIGPETVKLFQRYLATANTVLWNGPLGAYEVESFSLGTKDILNYLANKESKVILGGGDTVAAASLAGVKDKVTHASTGGGATLEYLEGKELPALKIIEDKS